MYYIGIDVIRNSRGEEYTTVAVFDKNHKFIEILGKPISKKDMVSLLKSKYSNLLLLEENKQPKEITSYINLQGNRVFNERILINRIKQLK